jgi:D-alanine-D-alanine ligase
MYKTYRKQPLLIEQYIDGREFNISLLETVSGNIKVLPVAEMLFHDWPEGKPKIVGYQAKWNRESFEYKNTLRQFNPYDDPLSELSYIAIN